MTEAITMQTLFSSDGKAQVFGWILFIATLVLIVGSVWNCIASVSKLKKEDAEQSSKLVELEYNLKKVMGTNYTELPPSKK